MKNKIIYAFLNAYSQGKSGGDMCFIETFKRIKPKNLSVVTSSLGRRLCQNEALKAHFIITTRERSFKNIFFTYFFRIIKGIALGFSIKKIDIIYATSDSLPDIIPSVILKLRFPEKIFVTKMFHLIPKGRFVSFFFQQISLLFIRLFADVVIVDSNILKKQLTNKGFLRSKLHIIYPGITARKQNRMRQPADEKKFDGVFMSRLHKSKGTDDILPIWENVVRTLPQAKLAIIGQGTKKIISNLKKQIRKKNLENNVSLLGFLPDKKAFSVINQSKVFLFPSHEEGFGMIVGEVLLCNVPVIAYNLAVFGDTFKPVITTVPCFDINTFSKKTVEILKDYKVPRISSELKKILDKFSWEASAKKESDIINTNINN